jgi:hypothetical protein
MAPSGVTMMNSGETLTMAGEIALVMRYFDSETAESSNGAMRRVFR